MAGLSHFDNSKAATEYWEPIYLTQFEVIITPPATITQNVELMVEHVKNLSGLPELTGVKTVEQFYKFAKRTYASGAPDKTDAQLEIEFEVNLNDDNNAYIYNILRAWGDLTFDPLNGRQGLKKDYVGQIYVAVHNKAQDIFREFRFVPSYMIDPLTEWCLNYTDDKIYTCKAKFQCDAFKETRIGAIQV